MKNSNLIAPVRVEQNGEAVKIQVVIDEVLAQLLSPRIAA